MELFLLRNKMFLRILVIYLLLHVSNGLLQNVRSLKQFEGKIVGGTPVNLNLFPHSAQVYNMGNMCAGSVLNSWTVLTAAHCFDLHKDLEAIYIIVGARFTYDLNAPLHFVKKIDIHEKYNVTGHFACDIALMFVDRPIQFTKFTQKAIIVNTDEWMHPNQRNFTATGWGWTKYNGHISKLGLLMARLRFISLADCSRMHNITFSNDMFCLYGDGIRDTCKGDSGGGVLWKGMIVGITSHGDKCAKKNSPSVYSNVWYFKEWIKEHIFKFIDDYCKRKKKIKRNGNNDFMIV